MIHLLAKGNLNTKFGEFTEYLFYDLGSESLAAPFLLNGATEPFTFRPEFETFGHILRVGTNFPLN